MLLEDQYDYIASVIVDGLNQELDEPLPTPLDRYGHIRWRLTPTEVGDGYEVVARGAISLFVPTSDGILDIEVEVDVTVNVSADGKITDWSVGTPNVQISR